jgi:hypothetical protein
MKTVGELKDFIRNLPDHLIIVTSGSDHSYNLGVTVNEEQAEIDPKTKEMWEYYDEGNKNKKSNKVIDVLTITY